MEVGVTCVGKKVDLVGQRFGRLMVVSRVHDKQIGANRHSRWLCQCDCGNTTVVFSDKLRRGETTSCGCYREELSKEKIKRYNEKHISANKTHGCSKTRLYRKYQGMMSRCYDQSSPKYKNYGGRGISVCDEWRNKPQAFMEWAILNGYERGLTIDRINNDGNYEPTNCRWADMKTQGNNKTTNVFIVYNGEKLTISQFAEKFHIQRVTMWARYKKGWSVEKMTHPVRRKQV